MPEIHRHNPWYALKRFFGYSKTGTSQVKIVPKGLRPSLALGFDDLVSQFYYDQMSLRPQRHERYKSYDTMDVDDVVIQVLDLYAEDATQVDSATGKAIWVESANPAIEEFGNKLLETVEADEKVFPIARELAKYGDSFEALVFSQRADGKPGEVVGLLPAPVYVMSRHEDAEGRLKGFSIGPIEATSALGIASPGKTLSPTDPPWAFIHFRLLGKDRMCVYGTSFLAAGARTYRKLRLMEDNLVLYRLKRSPDRFIFYLTALEGLAPEERQQAMNEFRQGLRKQIQLDENMSTFKQEHQPIAIDDDIIADNTAVQVERLSGSQQVNQVLDIDYMRKRFFGTLGIPPDYLGFSDTPGSFAADIPLSFQDVNFARKEKRLQAAIMKGFSELIFLGMCWANMDPFAPDNRFTMHMNPVSAVDEKQRLEVEKIRMDSLRVLVDIGNELGLEGKEWQEYLLRRSLLPTHLLRKSGKDGASLLTGTVKVFEGKTKSSAQIEEMINKLPEEKKAQLGRFFQEAKRVFDPSVGPNKFDSKDISVKTYEDMFQDTGKKKIFDRKKVPVASTEEAEGEQKTLMEATTDRIIKAKKALEEQQQKEEEQKNADKENLNRTITQLRSGIPHP